MKPFFYFIVRLKIHLRYIFDNICWWSIFFFISTKDWNECWKSETKKGFKLFENQFSWLVQLIYRLDSIMQGIKVEKIALIIGLWNWFCKEGRYVSLLLEISMENFNFFYEISTNEIQKNSFSFYLNELAWRVTPCND